MIIAVALSAAWAFAIRPIQLEFEGTIRLQLRDFLSSALRPYEIEVSYRNISPALWGQVKIRGISIASRGHLLATVPALDIGYDFLGLLRRQGGSSLKSITVSGMDLTFDPQRDKHLLDLIVRLASGQRKMPVLPEFRLVIKNSVFKLALPDGGLVELKANALKAAVGKPDIKVDAKAEILASLASPVLGLQTIRVPVSAAGYVLADFSLAEAAIRFTAIAPGFTLKDRTWRFKATKDSVTAALSGKAGPPEASLVWDAMSRRLQASVVMDKFKPSSLIAVSGGYKSIEPLLAGGYSGRLEANTDFTAGGTDFSANLDAQLPFEAPGGRINASVLLSGSLNQVDVQRIRLDNASLGIQLSGTAYPAKLGFEGLLTAAYALNKTDEIRTSMEIFASGGSVFAYANETRVADALIHDLTASISFKGEELFFLIDAMLPTRTGAIQNSAPSGIGGVSLAENRSKLSFEGSVWLGKSPYFSASLSLESLALAGFSRALESLFDPAASGFLRNLVFSGNLSVYGDFKDFSYSVSNAIVSYAALKNTFAVLTLQGNRRKIELSKIDAHVAGYSISGRAAMVLESEAARSVQVDISINDIPYAIDASFMENEIYINGNYGVRVILNTGDTGISGSISAENFPIPVGKSIFFVTSNSFLQFESFDNWKLVLESLSVVPSGTSVATMVRIDLAGELHQNGAYLKPVRVQGTASALEGTIDVTWGFASGLRVAFSSVLNGLNGESYRATGEYAAGSLSAAVSARKAVLERWNIDVLKGIANMDAKVSGPLLEPKVIASFTFNEGRELPKFPYLEGSGTYEAGVIRLDSLNAYLEGLSVNNAAVEYDIATGTLSCDGDINYGFQAFEEVSTVIGKFSAKGNAPGAALRAIDAPHDLVTVFSANPIDSFSEYRISGSVTSFSVRGKKYNGWPFDLALGTASLNLVCGSNRELVLKSAATGEFSASVAPGLPVSGDLTGRVLNGVVNIKTENARADMPFLFAFLALPVVKAKSGVAFANIQISGPVSDPLMNGLIEFENVFFTVNDFVSDPIGPINAPLNINGKEAELTQALVACGDASVSVQLVMPLSRWLPQSVRINVKGSESLPVHVKSTILGLKIDGYAAPELVVAVDANGPKVSGKLTFPKGDIEITTETLARGGGQFVRPPEGALSADMQILFGKSVSVKFQPYKFAIFSGQTDPSSQLRVQYNGDTGDYSVKGKTILRGGSVFYIQKNFFLKTATVTFDEDSSSFDPLVTLKAETRTSNARGSVLVLLSADNVPLQSLAFKLESIPSYSELEIAQLLGQSLTATNKGGDFDPGKALIENSDLIPQLDIVSLFKTQVQSVLGLDVFYMKSLAVQRWLYDLSGLGSGVVPMTLSDYLENTSIVAGKYLSDNLFLQLMFRLQDSPLAQAGNLRVDSEISLEWNAPHFLLNWQIKPDLYNYFLPEQSLSVSWRIVLP